MTLKWFEVLAKRLTEAADEARFAGNHITAATFRVASTAAERQARSLRNELEAQQLHPSVAGSHLALVREA